jgi:hypothetical protein
MPQARSVVYTGHPRLQCTTRPDLSTRQIELNDGDILCRGSYRLVQGRANPEEFQIVGGESVPSTLELHSTCQFSDPRLSHAAPRPKRPGTAPKVVAKDIFAPLSTPTPGTTGGCGCFYEFAPSTGLSGPVFAGGSEAWIGLKRTGDTLIVKRGEKGSFGGDSESFGYPGGTVTVDHKKKQIRLFGTENFRLDVVGGCGC